jgi:hypothetical protein
MNGGRMENENRCGEDSDLVCLLNLLAFLDGWCESIQGRGFERAAKGALEKLLADQEEDEDLPVFLELATFTVIKEMLLVGHAASLCFLGQVEPPALRETCATVSQLAFGSYVKSWGNGALICFVIESRQRQILDFANQYQPFEDVAAVCIVASLYVGELLLEESPAVYLAPDDLRERAEELGFLFQTYCKELMDGIAACIRL